MLEVFRYALLLAAILLRPPGLHAQNGTAAATGTHGMVSAAHPLAADAGISVLRSGGNAFDAAVAIAAVLNVVEPNMSGVGGYGTILVYDASERRIHFLNPSGRIPRGVDADAFRPPTPEWRENRRGAKAVSTPGNAAAWEAMWNRWGVRPWPSLFHDAVRLAEGGFSVSPALAGAIADAWQDFPEHARTFYGRGAAPLAAGDTLVQQDLGHTFRRLAAHGAAVIHGGAVGAAIDSAMQESGGYLRLPDLRENRAEWWEAIHIRYRDTEVYSASPPANAFDALVRLGIMSRFDVQSLGHNSVPFLHRFAEATKHGFWVRLRWAGDPEVARPPLDSLFAPAYWERQASAIDTARASTFVPPDIGSDRHTTHFVVADRWGNVVSATQTLGNSFGARIMVPGTGLWLNNSLAYSTFEPPGNPMDAHAGRRKLSGDVPVIVMRDGRPWAVLGTPGGHTIGQTVPQMVMNLVDFRMSISDALAAPRISFVEPDLLAVEEAIPRDVRDALSAMGHEVRPVRALGNAHGLTITWDESGRPVEFAGAADPRGEGVARGLVVTR